MLFVDNTFCSQNRSHFAEVFAGAVGSQSLNPFARLSFCRLKKVRSLWKICPGIV
jgi:hypothetical protein